MVALVSHDLHCPNKGMGHSDAAKRCSDEYTMHRLAAPYDSIGHWIAIRLYDGGSDHVLYDCKHDAVTHQHHNEQWYAFVQIRPSNMSVCDAEIFLKVHRRMYDAGLRMVDPDTVRMPEPIKRVAREDMAAQLRTILSGGRIAPTNLIIGGR